MAKQWKWTPEEESYLEDTWGVKPVDFIAKHLNRSIDAVIVRKDRLGLGSFLGSGDYVTFNQLLIALGKTGGSGYKITSWVKNRNFPIKYKRVKDNKFKVVYLHEFWAWAKKNRTMIDWSKVDPDILGEEPSWVKTQREADFKKNSKVKMTPWAKSEDELLKSLLKQFKYSYSDLSKRLHRTEGAIQRRITDLGIKERPLRADNHVKWTDAEFEKLTKMIKQGLSYELMSDVLGKSSKAIRGRVYMMYLTENLDKVAVMIGKGSWSDGRPERPITHRCMNAAEKAQVCDNLTTIVTILKHKISEHYEGSDYWQRELCAKWDDLCLAGEPGCDYCESFVRIRPQYCRRCGATFLKREKADICDRCKVMRKKQYQRKWMVLQGIKNT